jgi:hypothetical protein
LPNLLKKIAKIIHLPLSKNSHILHKSTIKEPLWRVGDDKGYYIESFYSRLIHWNLITCLDLTGFQDIYAHIHKYMYHKLHTARLDTHVRLGHLSCGCIILYISTEEDDDHLGRQSFSSAVYIFFKFLGSFFTLMALLGSGTDFRTHGDLCTNRRRRACSGPAKVCLCSAIRG